MKKSRFLMVALTLLMGLSFTSCLGGGDDESTYDGMHLVLVRSLYGTPVFEDASGVQLIPTAASLKQLESGSSTSISSYSFGLIAYKWVEGEEPTGTGELKGSYNINLLTFIPYDYGVARNAGSMDNLKLVAPETAPVMALSLEGGVPGMFNKNLIVLPIAYRMENKSEALKQHTFNLAAALDEVDNGDTELVFYLHHDRGTDEKTEVYNVTYYAYDIANVLTQFQYKAGKLPEKIIVKAHESGQYSTEMPKDYKEYSIKYSAE